MPRWITAFLDARPQEWDETLRFWSAVTGTTVSAPRGEDGEFVSLVPPDADPVLRVQRVEPDAATGLHLDLHMDYRRAAADIAIALGAQEVADRGHLVMRSAGGLPFCLVTAPLAVRPRPVTWTRPGGGEHRSLLDQVALDIPVEHWEAELEFWQELTGWTARQADPSSEFAPLDRPVALPFRLLPHRLGEPTGSVRAHLDLASTDRAAEVARHVALGAEVEGPGDGWTVLRDPVGRRYCVTDRDPAPSPL